MSTLASCPRCARQVTIPRGAESSDTVRCPLCAAEYSLEEALATTPPTLVVVRSLAVVAPEHPAENESALHVFPAADSGIHIADAPTGSSGLDLDIAAQDAAAHAGPAPHERDVHAEAPSDQPAEHFTTPEFAGHELAGHEPGGHEHAGHEPGGHEHAGHDLAGPELAGHDLTGHDVEGLELPSAELASETHAAADAALSASPWSTDDLVFSESLPSDSVDDTNLENEHGDFLASFDDVEPPAGAPQGEIPAAASHRPAEEPLPASEFGAAEADWLGGSPASDAGLDLAGHESGGLDLAGHESGGLDLPGHEPTGLPPHAPGDALAEQGTDEISFGDEEDESFSLQEGESDFETVNLDTGFEEVRPVPEDGDGYALDHEPAETEGAEEELVAAGGPPERPVRRKPSLITNVIMYVVCLIFALPVAYAFMFYYAKMDPIHLALVLPSSIVPDALNPKIKLAAAPPIVSQPAPNAADDPNATTAPDPDNAQPTADASGFGAAGADSDGGMNAVADSDDNDADDPAMANDNPLGETASDTDDATDADLAGDSAPSDTPDADMPAEDTAADDTDADADGVAAMPADADADADTDATPADSDAATAGTDLADSADTDADAGDALPADAAGDEKLEIIVADPDEPADADADDMPAESDPADDDAAATAAKDKDSKDKDADDDDANDIAAKDPAAKAAAADDDAAVSAALDAAMTDDDTDQPATHVGPRNTAEYTPADIDQALTGLASAIKGLNLAAKDDQKKAKAQYYRKLYQLAEVATFTPSMAVGAKVEEGSQQDVVYQTLTGSAANPGKFTEVGKAAAKWLEAAKGKEHQGIVLSGTLESTHASGGVFETRVLLTDGKSAVTVLSPVAPNAGQLSGVLVWGSIVDDPTQNIAGYEGDAPTVVWTTGVEAAPPGAAWKPMAPGSR